MAQAQVQVIDLVAAWKNGTVNQKQELAKGLFPDGLVFSEETKFFEPRNKVLIDMSLRWLEGMKVEGMPIFEIGAGDGI